MILICNMTVTTLWYAYRYISALRVRRERLLTSRSEMLRVNASKRVVYYTGYTVYFKTSEYPFR